MPAGLVRDLAEALYQVRRVLPAPTPSRGQGRAGARLSADMLEGLRHAEGAIVAALGRCGEAPGETADEADAIKLRAMGVPCAPVRAIVEPAAPVPTVDDLLNAAVEVNGSDLWRELARFAQFRARISFAGRAPHPFDPTRTLAPLIPDDPHLPVYPWVRAEGREPPTTVLDAVKLYLDWTKAVQAVWKELRERPRRTGELLSQAESFETTTPGSPGDDHAPCSSIPHAHDRHGHHPRASDAYPRRKAAGRQAERCRARSER